LKGVYAKTSALIDGWGELLTGREHGWLEPQQRAFQVNPGPSDLLKLPPDVTFDSGLTVSGDQLRYAVEQNDSLSLTLDITRTKDQLSGTLHTMGLAWPGIRPPWCFY